MQWLKLKYTKKNEEATCIALCVACMVEWCGATNDNPAMVTTLFVLFEKQIVCWKASERCMYGSKQSAQDMHNKI